jgi:hypothetical protein
MELWDRKQHGVQGELKGHTDVVVGSITGMILHCWRFGREPDV